MATRAQHAAFKRIVNVTAEKLVGQPREVVMAEIEKINQSGVLATQVGPLRFGFRQAVQRALEDKTNKLRTI